MKRIIDIVVSEKIGVRRLIISSTKKGDLRITLPLGSIICDGVLFAAHLHHMIRLFLEERIGLLKKNESIDLSRFRSFDYLQELLNERRKK